MTKKNYRNCWKWLDMAGHVRNGKQKSENGWTFLEIAENGWKLMDLAGNSWKELTFYGNVEECL